MGEKRNAYKILVTKSEGIKRNKILIINWIRTGSVVGYFDHDNEPLSFIKGRQFLECISNYQPLKYNCPRVSLFILVI
jgi:hypothetical protein